MRPRSADRLVGSCADEEQSPSRCGALASATLGVNSGGAGAARPPDFARMPDGECPVTGQEIEAKVIAIVAKQMGVDEKTIKRETNFTSDLNADSLDTVELVMEFEDEFDVKIPDEQAEKIQTVGQTIDLIKQAKGI